MSVLMAFVLLLGGAVGAALVAGLVWFCVRLLQAVQGLTAAAGRQALAQSQMLKDAAVMAELVREASDRMNQASCQMAALAEGVRALADGKEVFPKILTGLAELDTGIKSFLSLVVNTQIHGATPADLVRGTVLDTSSSVYPYNEREMVMREQENIRRRARGEPDLPAEEVDDGDKG